MIRYLIFPLVICLIIAIYNISKQMVGSYKVSRERKRREAEHLEFMSAYNTRRQLYSEVYSTSRKYELYGTNDKQMQENISSCFEDDEVEIEYDQSRNKYAATCNGGKIGYLPSEANDVIRKISDRKAIISMINIDSKDKYCAHITVYSNE